MNQFPSHPDLSCKEVQDTLEAYLDDELDVNTSATVAAHVASCSLCQDEIRFAYAIRGALQELPKPEPPPEIFNAVEAYVRTHQQGTKVTTTAIAHLTPSAAVCFASTTIMRCPSRFPLPSVFQSPKETPIKTHLRNACSSSKNISRLTFNRFDSGGQGRSLLYREKRRYRMS